MSQLSPPPAARIDLAALNAADDAACAQMLEPLVERSPWMAARVAAARPFKGAEALSVAIEEAILGLSHDDRLRLLCAHPELAMPRPEAMTSASQQEQGRLGLTAPATQLRARLDDLNAAYRARFGFPFVIALHRVADLAAVVDQFETRLNAPPEAEIMTALAAVASVSRARAFALVGPEQTARADGGQPMTAAGGISVHAVDVASGQPAGGLGVQLWRIGATGPHLLAEGACGPAGGLDHPCVGGAGVVAGLYEARFAIGEFYRARGMILPDPAFLDEAVYRFGIADAAQHYHLPLKFTAWGFSLFRGGQ